MLESEFDKFADEYRALHAQNIRLSGESPEYFAEYKIRDVAEALTNGGQSRMSELEIVDFGAGVGASVPYFHKYFPMARLTCVDVSRKSLALAASRFPGLAEFVCFDGASLPFDEGRFDIAFAACVFHHIDDCKHGNLLQELWRILNPRGVLFIFEHNPINPLTRYAVRTCEFDANAHLISGQDMKRKLAAAGFATARLRYRVFFPRALAALRQLERYLSAVPLGAQYYVVAEKR